MTVKEAGSAQGHAEAHVLIISAAYLRALVVSSDFELGF